MPEDFATREAWREPVVEGFSPRSFLLLTIYKKPLILRRMTITLTLAALLFLQDAPPIRNFLRIDSNYCTGGQPTMQQLERLKAEGITTIINLRTADEHNSAQEETRAKELGLRYFNIPVIYSNPREEQVTEFLKLMEDSANRPVFIHCTAAIRVGAFWLVKRVLQDGWTLEAADQEAQKIGLRNSPHLVEFARAYIEKHKKR
jgi:uncharacterized protein (TIGR01244 family)